MKFPHCDARVLHAPGKCKFCDMHPELQKLREIWNISFTGEIDIEGKTRCPAEQIRAKDMIELWPGNRPIPEGK